MIDVNPEHFLWSEKYRPKKIEDCILPESMKAFFKAQVAEGQIQNMLFCGSHGTGKTTTARAIVDEIGADILFINCSKDNGVDQMRNRISATATTVSLVGKPKIIICDEFDYFSPNGQAAARGVIEEVAANCRFIMTCNYPAKIIEPLRSRLVIQDFTIDTKIKPTLAKQFFKRCCEILEAENVEYDKKAVADFILVHFPDYRKVVSELQRAALSGGEVTAETLNAAKADVAVYLKAIEKKDFKAARKFIGEMSMSPADFISALYEELPTVVQDSRLGQIIITLNDYQFKNAMVANPTLNLAALTIELMVAMS